MLFRSYIFCLSKNYFPYSAADRYETLCKTCFPEKEQQVNELFNQGIPDYDTIDALGEGNIYAKLQSLTTAKSEKEILIALMTADEELFSKLKIDRTWNSEYKKLSQLLGYKSTAKSFEDIHAELWRIMLFSEFVFDLPISLPEKLQSAPIIKESSKTLVLDLVKSIRNNKTCEQLYVEKANEVEQQLSLANTFKNETNLGSIVTFAFEDNTYFNHFVNLLNQSKWEEAGKIIRLNKSNIWLQHDEERRKIWLLAEYAIKLCKLCIDDSKLPKSASEIINLYANKLYEVDLYQRRYEMTLAQLIIGNTSVENLSQTIRKQYRTYTNKWQKVFQESISQWPVEGIESNIKIFDKYIAPILKGKRKVAYIMVDALRFELGKELEESLSKHFTIQTTPVCAYLPTVTKFGMAALLPDAEKALSLEVVDGKLEAHLNGVHVKDLQARKNYLKEKLGDRCDIVKMELLLLNYKEQPDLLIVTTNEIDAAGENLSINALSAIQQSIQNLVRGLIAIRSLGYEKIIITTDHGFMLHPDFHPGDNVLKPDGEWVMQKSRSLAGKGIVPEFSLSFSTSELGIKSSIEQFVFLKNYAVFTKNTQFFHEGLSLQETIVPMMEITLTKTVQEVELDITLTYRGKSNGSITTRRPLIDLSCFLQGSSLSFNTVVIKIEALSNNILIGQPLASDTINEITRYAEVYPNSAYKIPFEMEDDFEGEFEIIASDPITGKTFAKLKLSTNYLD